MYLREEELAYLRECMYIQSLMAVVKGASRGPSEHQGYQPHERAREIEESSLISWSEGAWAHLVIAKRNWIKDLYWDIIGGIKIDKSLHEYDWYAGKQMLWVHP